MSLSLPFSMKKLVSPLGPKLTNNKTSNAPRDLCAAPAGKSDLQPATRNFLLLLGFLLLALGSSAQFDTKHYLPPVWAGSPLANHNANVKLVVSTSVKRHPVSFTVRKSDGTFIASSSCQSGSPETIILGNTNTNATSGIAKVGDEFTVLDAQGVMVEADEPVCVALTQNIAGGDQWSLTSKGQKAMGTDFRSGHMRNAGSTSQYSNTNRSHVISIMATEDDTQVDIDIDNVAVALSDGTTVDKTITLQAGQSYIVRAKTDVTGYNENLSGTHIHSSKDVVIISGTIICTQQYYVSGWKYPGDSGFDEIVPEEVCGSEYIVQYGKSTRVASEVVNAVAIEDNTVVFVDGVVEDTISKGDHLYIQFPSVDYGAPMKVQFRLAGTGTGVVDDMTQVNGYIYQQSGGGLGEMGMSIIPSLECKGTLYSEFETLGSDANINIVATHDAVVTIGGSPIIPTDTLTLNSKQYDVYSEAAPATGIVQVKSDKLMHVGMMYGTGTNGLFAFYTSFTAPPLLSMGDVSYAAEDNYLYAMGLFTKSEWFYNGKSLGIKTASGTTDSIEVSLPGTYSVSFATDCGWTDTSSIVVKPNPAGPYPGGVYCNRAWFRADKESSNASYWGNYAGHMFLDSIAASATAPGLEPDVINFNPAYDFNGSNTRFEAYDYFNGIADADVSIGNGTDAKEVFAVSILESGIGGFLYLGDPAAAPNSKLKNLNYLLNYDLNYSVLKAAGQTTDAPSTLGYLINEYNNVTTSTVNVATPTIHNFALEENTQIGENLFSGNGSALSTYTSSTASTTIIPDITYHNLRVGTGISFDGTLGQPFDGKIAEIIYFHDTLTSVERQKVNSYLAIKYGITLDMGVNAGAGQNYLASSGDTVWDASVNADYNNDIFGLAQDSMSMLEQRISHSINATGVLTASLEDNFIGPNSSLTATIANGDFTLFGNDAQPSTISKLDNLPDGYNIRSERTWLTQTTVSKNVYLKFDIRMDKDTKYYLAVRNGSDDFTGTAATLTQMNTDSTVNVTLNNGDYFTIVAYKPAPGGVLGSGRVNGVYYELYTGGYDNNPADGITGDLRTTGYFDDLTDFQVLVASEINSNYSIVAKTQLKVSTAGDYNLRFNGLADAGALFVDGNLYTAGNAITLSAGYHNLEVRVSTNGGPNYEVQWRPDGGTYAAIDDSLLYVDAVMTSWHKADAQVTNTGEGTDASAWYDQSLSGNDLLNSDLDLPLYYETTSSEMMNFNPSVKFDGDDLDGDNDHSYGFAIGTQNRTTFAVTSEASGTGWRYIMTYGNRDMDHHFMVGVDNLSQQVISFSSNHSQGSTGYYNKEGSYLSTAQYENSAINSTGNVLGYLNGYSEITDNETVMSTYLYADEDFSIGAGVYSENPFKGNIAEVINYPWVLNDLERRKVETYLAVKYGITLDQTTPTDYIASSGDTIWDANINTAYNHDIFGLGRDDIDSLDQRVSKSVNDTTVLTLSMSVDFDTTNLSDTRSAMAADLRFLMMGSNDSTVAVNDTTELPGSGAYNIRMKREWFVQPTDVSTETVYLKFDSCYTTPTVKYYMLVDDDGDFTTGNITSIELDAKGVPTALYSFTSNVYITVVAYQYAPGGIPADLKFWARADKGVHGTSADVTAWDNYTQNLLMPDSLTKYNSSGSNKLTLSESQFNFNPGINSPGNTYFGCNFNGSTLDNIASTALTDGSKLSAYIVMDNVTSGVMLSFNSSASNTVNVFTIESAKMSWGGSVTNRTFLNYTLADRPTLLSGIYGNTEFAGYIDEKLGSTVSEEDATFEYRTFNIFQFINTSAWSGVGDVAEVIIYDADHHTTASEAALERRKIETYLAVKYGITLDQSGAGADYIASNGDTIWSVAANSTGTYGPYNQNIFGIGRDDVEALDQRISHSVNDTKIDLTLSLNLNFDSTNTDIVSHDTEFGNNLQYLLVSDNGGDTSLVNPIYGGTYYGMDKVWRTSLTGNFGQNIFVSFGDRYASNDSIKYFVVYKIGNDDFSAGAYHHEIDGFGNIANVQVHDNAYFTIVYSPKVEKSPGGVNSERLWLRGDIDVNFSGDTAQWIDYSGNGYIYTQDTAGYKPYYGDSTINFNYALYFNEDAANSFTGRDYLENKGSIVSNLYSTKQTIFTVAKRGVNDGNVDIIYYVSNGNGPYYEGFTGTSQDMLEFHIAFDGYEPSYLLHDGYNTYRELVKNGPISAQPVLSTAIHEDLTIGLYTNSAGYSSLTGATSPAHDTASYSRIGGFATNSPNSGNARNQHFFTGKIAEVIAYTDSVLTGNDIQRIESYLAIKYGITLDQSSPTNYLISDNDSVWDASEAILDADNDYNHDIFGMGKDDVSALYQCVSKSVNSDAILTVALENDFTSPNDTSLRTSSGGIQNMQFVMLGNNDSTVTVDKTDELPLGCERRMAREWRVQRTSSFVQPVYFKFDGDYTTTGTGRYMLVADGDGDFATGRVKSLATLDADGVARVAKLDSTVQFVTVVYKEHSPGGVNEEKIWLRSDIGVDSTNSTVNVWNDFASCLTPATKGSLTIKQNSVNFNPSVSFNGTAGNYFDLNGLTENYVAGQAFVVTFQYNGNIANPNESGLWRIGGNSSSYVLNANEKIVEGFGSNGATAEIAPPARSNTPYLYSVGKSAGTGINLYWDEDSIYADNTSVTYFSNSNNDYLGQNLAGNAYLGEIAEFIMYDTVLSDVERVRVESYLAIKYGITLSNNVNGNATDNEGLESGTGINEGDYISSDSTVIWDATTYNAYHNNIAGIGTDSTSMLLQRISHSVDSSAILILSTDSGFTAPNLGAGRNSLANGNFVVTGNNGADITFTLAFDGYNNTRMARSWVFDITGTADSVYLAIPNTIAFPNGSVPAIVLSGGDDNFGTDDEIVPLNDDGLFYWAKVKPADALYYTFFGITDRADMKYIMRHGKYFKQGGEQPMEW